MYDLEERALQLYDKVYAFCDARGMVELAHKFKKRGVQRPRPTCDKSIMCNEAQGCGRRNCPARTVNVSYYWRTLHELDFQRYLLAKYCEETIKRLAVGYLALQVGAAR